VCTTLPSFSSQAFFSPICEAKLVPVYEMCDVSTCARCVMLGSPSALLCFLLFFFFAVLGSELRDLHLLGK
jgi:hypothetical protein